MATINGKTVLFNESILFPADQEVVFSGPLHLTVKARPAFPLATTLTAVNGRFELHLDGYSLNDHDQVASGTGNHNGQNFQFFVHGQLIAMHATGPIYEVAVTFFAV